MGTPLLLGTGAFSSYDPDAILYFNQLTGTVSSTFKNAINTLILKLKSDNNWSALDRLWVHATENQQNGRISVVNPTSTPITEVNSPTWTINKGYTGNGTTMYLNTNFNPNTQGVNFIQNSNCHGAYIITNQDSKCVMGWDQGGTNISYLYPRLSNVAYFRSNMTTTIPNVASVSNVDSRGLFVAVRPSSSQMLGYKNGTQIASANNTSNTIPNSNAFVLAWNSSGPIEFYTGQVSISFFGSGAINQSLLYSAIQTFATTIGFNV